MQGTPFPKGKLPPVTVFYVVEVGLALLFAFSLTLNMVYQVTVVGLTPLQLVLVGTMVEVTCFLGEIPTGIVADVYSRRLSVIIGVALVGIGFTVEGAIPTFGAVLLSMVIWGLGATFQSGAWAAWITDEIGEEAAAPVFQRGAQFALVGGLVGIGLAAWVGSYAVNLPLVIGGMCHFFIVAFMLLFMPETGFKPTPREDRNTWQAMGDTLRDGVRHVRGRPLLGTILAVALVGGLYSEGYDRLNTPHLLAYNLPPLGSFGIAGWFSLLAAVGTVLSIIGTEIIRRTVPTRDPQVLVRVLAVLDIAIMVSIIGFAWAPTYPIAIVFIWTVGILRGNFGPLYMAWANKNIESSVRATVLSMSAQLNAVGQIAGGPVLGWVGNRSLRWAITLAGLGLLPNLFFYTIAARQSKVETPVTGELEVTTT